MKKIAFYLMTIAVIAITACNDSKNIDDYMYIPKADVTGVTLDQAQLELARNATATLKATIAPARAVNQNITWSTSDENVASVTSDGVVLAKDLGTANITVTTEDGGKTAVCALTVVEQTATDVTVNNSTLTLKVGDGETLTTTVSPDNTSNKQVTWSSDAEGIATVSSSGEVKALAPGTANITATTVSGGKKATCVVTVIQPVTGIEFSDDKVPVLIGSTYTLKATVLPADASDKSVTWKVSGSGIVITDYSTPGEVTVQRTGEGDAIVTAVTNDGGFEASCTVIEKPFYPNTLDPFSATLADNFQYGTLESGYSGLIMAGPALFQVGDIPTGSKYEIEMEFTVSRDFEADQMNVILVDTRQEANWWTAKGNTIVTGTYKAGTTISQTVTITTTEDTSSAYCDIHIETGGAGTPGTAGSGVKGPVTLNFTKFIVNKLDE